MTTFDDILSSYVDYTNLADAAAGAALLRDCAGFKLTQNETFTDGPGDRYITVFGSVLETILKLDTAITVASYYETNEELGNALSLATFSGDAVGLARTASSGKYMRKIHTIFWYEMTSFTWVITYHFFSFHTTLEYGSYPFGMSILHVVQVLSRACQQLPGT